MTSSRSLREQQKQQLRRRLVESALHLFREQGVSSTTVEQITLRTGVAKGTFFNYFPSKASLLAEYARNETNEILRSTLSAPKLSPRDLLMTIAERLGQLGEQNRLLMLDLGLLKSEEPALIAAERSHDDEIRQTLMQRIHADPAVEKSWSKARVEKFTELVFSMLSGTVHEWRMREGELELSAALRSRMSLLLELLPAEGQ